MALGPEQLHSSRRREVIEVLAEPLDAGKRPVVRRNDADRRGIDRREGAARVDDALPPPLRCRANE